eukprot:gb/GFBE01072118.1/.p1 GENE.gb/GFBE01072118.1/~~gb/GFBE01072118.1/.p1  ORF type:complete len:353 (+),score=35.67 gb/GFBE01072118.1/:1-1059(+)
MPRTTAMDDGLANANHDSPGSSLCAGAVRQPGLPPVVVGRIVAASGCYTLRPRRSNGYAVAAGSAESAEAVKEQSWTRPLDEEEDHMSQGTGSRGSPDLQLRPETRGRFSRFRSGSDPRIERPQKLDLDLHRHRPFSRSGSQSPSSVLSPVQTASSAGALSRVWSSMLSATGSRSPKLRTGSKASSTTASPSGSSRMINSPPESVRDQWSSKVGHTRSEPSRERFDLLVGSLDQSDRCGNNGAELRPQAMVRSHSLSGLAGSSRGALPPHVTGRIMMAEKDLRLRQRRSPTSQAVERANQEPEGATELPADLPSRLETAEKDCTIRPRRRMSPKMSMQRASSESGLKMPSLA